MDVAKLKAERDKLKQQRDEVREARNGFRVERDQAQAALKAAERARSAAEAEREKVAAERDRALAELEALRAGAKTARKKSEIAADAAALQDKDRLIQLEKRRVQRLEQQIERLAHRVFEQEAVLDSLGQVRQQFDRVADLDQTVASGRRLLASLSGSLALFGSLKETFDAKLSELQAHVDLSLAAELKQYERFVETLSSLTVETKTALAPVVSETPVETLFQPSVRDQTKPEKVNGKPVGGARWRTMAEERFQKEVAFRESGEFARVEAMRGKHAGKRAFIIGNGPSINTQDLTLLKDEITFCANWFINHPQFNDIQPSYYCVSSHEMFGGWGKTPNLNEDFREKLKQKLTPESTMFFSFAFRNYMKELGLLDEEQLRYLIFDRPKLLVDEVGSQNFDLGRCMDDAYTVLLTFAVPLAVHFGITDLYLIGCDCDYGLTTPEAPRAYFYAPSEHKTSSTKFENIARIWGDDGPIFQSYRICSDTALMKGLRMWNATAGGRLEVLPRVSYLDVVGRS
ncbi:putative coiled-coil protein SlyX [Methylopila jiangsuensis]|nr:hypothetical protein [Methylopila jiangsuensis]MDR6286532.1 putative coiled-coil protein SlyX [Methylopila jiangsuensis]